MKKFFLSLALFAGLFAATPSAVEAAAPAKAAAVRISVNPRPFYATVQETVIIGYRTVIDAWGRVYTVPVYGVQYRTVLVQYNRLTGTYYYYNSLGQAVPYYGPVPLPVR